MDSQPPRFAIRRLQQSPLDGRPVAHSRAAPSTPSRSRGGAPWPPDPVAGPQATRSATRSSSCRRRSDASDFPQRVLGAAHPFCLQRTALDVAGHRQNRLIRCHGKGLEATLGYRADPRRPVMRVLALGKGDREPPQPVGEVAPALRSWSRCQGFGIRQEAALRIRGGRGAPPNSSQTRRRRRACQTMASARRGGSGHETRGLQQPGEGLRGMCLFSRRLCGRIKKRLPTPFTCPPTFFTSPAPPIYESSGQRFLISLSLRKIFAKSWL